MRFGGGARVALGGFTTLLGLLITAPALGEPFITLSTPVEVDESREWVPRGASVADIATNGTNSLAVYSGPDPYLTGEGFIMGRRLGAGGAPDDGTPFEIYSGATIGSLRVVYDGTGYIVLWTEGVANDYSLHFMRLKADGDIITDAETLEQSSDVLLPAIAVGETGTFVVRGSSDGCRTWLITSDAAVEGDPISLNKSVSPTVGFSDGAWLLAYTEPDANDTSYFVQYGGDAHVLPGTTSSLAASASANWQRIAPAADGFVVARQGAKIDFVHVDFDGTAALEPYELAPATQELGPYPPSFIATATGYAIVYDAHAAGCADCASDGWLQPLKPTLEAATARPLALVANASTFLAATLTGGTDALLTWKDRHQVFRGAPLSLGDNPLLKVDVAVSVGLPDQGSPRVAPGSFGWLAVWPEERITDGRVSGVLLDDAGNPEGNPVVLTPELETLSDLVRGPQGWLMTSEVPLALHLISEKLQVTNVSLDAPSTAFARVAGSNDGWLVSWLEPVAGVPSLRVARVNEAGTVVDSTTVASVSDLTVHHALSHAGAYEVLWTDGAGNLWSVQIPTGGCLSVSTPQKLANVGHAAHIDVARSAGTWWGWMNLLGKFIFRTADGQVFPDDGFALPMTEVDGLVLTGTKAFYPDSYLSIGLAAPNSPLKVLATASGTSLGLSAADLSDSFEHRALLATLEPDWVAGEITSRITTRVITVVGGTPQGGSGGTGGSGGCGNIAVGLGGEGGDAAQSAAGQSMGGTSAGSPDVPSAAGDADQPVGTGGTTTQPSGNAGHTGTPIGGEPSSTSNDGEAGDATLPPGSPPRTSSSCGCRVAGSDDNNGSLAASLLLGLTLLERRRRAQRASWSHVTRPWHDQITIES